MKAVIKDKKKIIAISLSVVLVIIIIIISFPPLINIIFGNRIDDEVKTVTTDVVSEYDIGVINDNFCIYNSQGLKKYSVSGKFEQEFYISSYSPIMDSNGKFVALADTESREISVTKNNLLKYKVKIPRNVKSISVNSSGYITVVTSETGYKSLVIVYDSMGTEKYRWYSDESYVIDARLSDNSRTLAVAAINVNKSNVDTVVLQFKLSSDNPVSKVIIKDTIAYQLVYESNGITVATDKKMVKVSRGGKIKSEYNYEGRALECFDIKNKDNIVLALSEDSNATQVISLNRNLKEKGIHKSDFLVTMLDENNGKSIVAGSGNVEILNANARVLLSGELKKDGKYILLSKNWRRFAVFTPSQINIFTVKRGR